MITHLAFYAGWPAAMTAAHVASKVFDGERSHEGRIHRPRHHGRQHGGQPAEGRPRAGRARRAPRGGRAAYRGRRRLGGHAARRSPRPCEVVFTSLPGPPEVEAVALGRDGLLAGHDGRQGATSTSRPTRPALVRRLHAVFADAGRPHARRAGERRAARAPRAGKLAIWVGGDERRLRALQAGARRDRRPAVLHRPDRRRLGRQARAQLRRLRDPDRAGRGLHHGREGGRRSARALGGGAPGRARPAPHLRRAGRPVPARQVRPAGLRAAARPQGRLARHRARAASSACRCGWPT